MLISRDAAPPPPPALPGMLNARPGIPPGGPGGMACASPSTLEASRSRAALCRSCFAETATLATRPRGAAARRRRSACRRAVGQQRDSAAVDAREAVEVVDARRDRKACPWRCPKSRRGPSRASPGRLRTVAVAAGAGRRRGVRLRAASSEDRSGPVVHESPGPCRQGSGISVWLCGPAGRRSVAAWRGRRSRVARRSRLGRRLRSGRWRRGRPLCGWGREAGYLVCARAAGTAMLRHASTSAISAMPRARVDAAQVRCCEPWAKMRTTGA